MIDKLIDFILGRLPIIRLLNEHKTKIGLLLTILSAVSFVLGNAVELYPDVEQLEVAHRSLSELLIQLSKYLGAIGIPLTSIGAGHATVKERLARKEINRALG